MPPLLRALFALDNPALGQGLIYDTKGFIADREHPVGANEDLIILGTGLGPVNNPPATGVAASNDGTQTTILMPTVTVGGVNAPVIYSRLASGKVGYYEVRVRVPAGGQRGVAVPVKLSIGGAASNVVTAAICDYACPAKSE